MAFDDAGRSSARLALLAALGGHGLLQRRQWAPLLLLLGGTMVAGAGLAIVALTASYATDPGDADADVPLDWVFDQVDDETLWLLVAFAALLAVTGTLEAASGVMGAARRRSRRAAPHHGPLNAARLARVAARVRRRTARTAPPAAAR